MGDPDPELVERGRRASARLTVAADRGDELRAALAAELELRDRALIETIDEGWLSVRRAAAAARLSTTGVLHVLERAG